MNSARACRNNDGQIDNFDPSKGTWEEHPELYHLDVPPDLNMKILKWNEKKPKKSPKSLVRFDECFDVNELDDDLYGDEEDKDEEEQDDDEEEEDDDEDV
jgi:hypothetical protein